MRNLPANEYGRTRIMMFRRRKALLTMRTLKKPKGSSSTPVEWLSCQTPMDLRSTQCLKIELVYKSSPQ